MRIYHLIKMDIKTQFEYKFYHIYAIINILYLIVLDVAPSSSKEVLAIILVFGDCSALGLFFIGPLILFERNQHITNTLAASPVTISEYILSKVISLMILSIIVSSLMLFISIKEVSIYAIIGIFLTCPIFTMIGLCVATKTVSLNQYIIWIMPFQIVLFILPCISLFNNHPVFYLYPLVGAIQLMQQPISYPLPVILYLLVIHSILFTITKKYVHTLWQQLGGVKI